MKFMEEDDQKSRTFQNYNNWCKYKETKNYWTQREQERQKDQEDQETQERQKDDQNNQSSLVSTSSSTPTSSSSATRRESIESISLDEAKDLILPRLLPCDTASMKDSLDITTSLARFQAHVFNSLTPTSLLTFETHLQHLLAMSNILIVGKNKNHPDLDEFVSSNMKDIRKSLCESVDFCIMQQKFPYDIMSDIINIVNDINCGLLSKLNAVGKILAKINDDMDPVVIRLLLCVKSMIEILPSDSQKKAVLEFQVSTRYLQPLLQTLFDEDDILFKWTNEAPFNDADNDLQDRPDGCIENDDFTIGYLEVKPIDKAKDHKKINRDLYRLGVFSKAATTKYKLKHTFQVMAVGTNLQFHISELKSNVLTMVELDHFRLPLSMDELPQLIPYLHRLYNVVATIYSCCYKQKKLNGICRLAVLWSLG
ncbi:hypothetical protein G6F49_001500 [Rhizopus delemar]|nr:hypothetical protein G6F49_001500 [Rhizopus delemar]